MTKLFQFDGINTTNFFLNAKYNRNYLRWYENKYSNFIMINPPTEVYIWSACLIKLFEFSKYTIKSMEYNNHNGCNRWEALFDLNKKKCSKIKDHKESLESMQQLLLLLVLWLPLTLDHHLWLLSRSFNIICLVTMMISRDNINNYVCNLCSGDYLAAFSQFSLAFSFFWCMFHVVWFFVQQCCDLCMCVCQC